MDKTQTKTSGQKFEKQPDRLDADNKFWAASSYPIGASTEPSADAPVEPSGWNTATVNSHRPSDYITDKERRLRQQNLEMQRPLRRVPKVIFNYNRFGPLMFLLAFGVVGLYFGVMTFASSDNPASRVANLSVEPSQRRILAGEAFTVRVWADSLSLPVNAVQAQLAYDAQSFEFVAIDATASSFSTDEASQPNGQGVLLSRRAATGLIGRQLVASVVLRAKATTGNASLWFDDSSKLIHASEQTNILQTTSGSTYYVSAASSDGIVGRL